MCPGGVGGFRTISAVGFFLGLVSVSVTASALIERRKQAIIATDALRLPLMLCWRWLDSILGVLRLTERQNTSQIRTQEDTGVGNETAGEARHVITTWQVRPAYV